MIRRLVVLCGESVAVVTAQHSSGDHTSPSQSAELEAIDLCSDSLGADETPASGQRRAVGGGAHLTLVLVSDAV